MVKGSFEVLALWASTSQDDEVGMDQQIFKNQLEKSRREDADSPEEMIKEVGKKYVKKWIWGMVLSAVVAVLPWLLLIGFFIMIWFAGCSNMGGGAKGWGISQVMKWSGMCGGF